MNLRRSAVAALAALVFAFPAAAVQIPTASPATETFTSLGTTATATLPADWKVDKTGVAAADARRVGTYAAALTATSLAGGPNLGTSAGNGIYNFGSGTTTPGPDRAVGFLSSSGGTASGNLYVQLTNNTGGNLSGLQLSYAVEKYRKGLNPAGFRVQMFYSTDGATWTNAGANFLTGFGADADNTGYATAPGVTSNVTNQTLSVAIPSGGTFYLAWNYSVTSGTTYTNAQALAIDDVSILGISAGGPTNPTGVGSASPATVVAGSTSVLTVAVTPGSNPASTGLTVNADLSAIGGSATQQFLDNGLNGDAVAGDNTFSYAATVAGGTTAGAKTLPFTVADAESRSTNGSIALTVAVPTNPSGTGSASPNNPARGTSTLLTVTVTPGTFPTSTGIAVRGDLTSIGGSASQAFSGSGNVFTYTANIPFATTLGGKTLPVSITDAQSRSGSTSISLTVANQTVAVGAIVISQVYGGGGNTGSTLRNDFIELFNRSNNPIDLTGWSVQHYSSSNTTWLATALTGIIQPHSYYLVQEAAGTTGGTTDLPTPDAIGTIGLSSSSGLTALSSSMDVPTSQCGLLTSSLMDFVSYGSVSCSGKPAVGGPLVNTIGIARVLGGCKYTPAATDFAIGAPAPRNSSTAQNNCTVTSEETAPHVMISQLYGGGGNGGAVFKNDFVELYNPTDTTVALDGWSIQYAAAVDSSVGSSNVQPLGGTIESHGYFLIELAAGTVGDGAALPPPRITSGINMSATNGKIALVKKYSALVGKCPISDPDLVDYVGYGTADCFEGGLAAPTLSTTTTLMRPANSDTNQNRPDFSVVNSPAAPRGTGDPVELAPFLTGFEPAATNLSSTTPAYAPFDASLSLSFSEPVNVAGGWFSLACTTSGVHSDVDVISAFAGRTWIVTPKTLFVPGESCTAHIFSAGVTDVDTDDAAADHLTVDTEWTFVIAASEPKETPEVHLTMGNPSNAVESFSASTNYLMKKPEYSLSYNADKGTANWVSWHLTGEWAGTLARVDTFRPDPAIPYPTWYRVLHTDYAGTGYDRGHMCPNADRDSTVSVMQSTFLMTNMVPQTPANNQGPWAKFEGYLRTLVPANELYIVSGPNGSIGTIAGGHVTVPESTWKVVLVLPAMTGDDVARVSAASRTIAIRIPNDSTVNINDDWTKYLTTVDAIESLTEYDFFSNIQDDAIENAIEAGKNGVNPPGAANQAITTNEDIAKSFTLDAASSGTTTYSVGTPAHGTLSGTAPNQTYTPAPDYFGPDSFTYTVTNDNGSATATVNITVDAVNDAPVLTGVAATATVAELTPLTFTATATDVDSVVTYSLVGAPAGAAIDPSTGAFSWTPTETQGPATYTFVVRASDGDKNADASIEVTVTEVNVAPVIASIGDQSINLGAGALEFSATATDDDVPVQTLAFSLSATAPAGATITSAGAFSFVPAPSQANQTFNFEILVTDGLAAVSTPVKITVVDANAPVITGISLSVTQLWPATHQMVDVTVNYTATDDAGAPSCSLRVASSEPVNGLGDGDTAPDWQVVDEHHVKLRAERSPMGNGRFYTISIDCVDQAPNLTTRSATVSVPKSLR
jgi:DNA/RNA endonuclease G (NUC1)